MVNLISKDKRSKIMSCIRSRNTKPEIAVRKALWGYGFSYQPKINGSPDFINKKRKIAIFVHGCFWHKCPRCFKEPASNIDYWVPKLQANVRRDRKNKRLLQNQGYKVFEIWEHQINKNLPKALNNVFKTII